MANREEIIKRNIAFMYGRGEQTAISDPDKFAFTRTHKFETADADAIREFTGEFDFLAPTFMSPVMLADDSVIYPSFEHALQASKTSDRQKRAQLAGITAPRELKRMGGKFAENVDRWRDIGVNVAEQLLRDKFIRNRELRQRLLATRRRGLVFNNDYGDQFWGFNADGKGQNHLGKCLEKVRLQAERGEDLLIWFKELFALCNSDDICVAVLVMRGTETVHETEVKDKSVFFVGKAPENEVVCESPTVSRRHAALVADTTRGLVLIDLDSANKTFINGVELSPYSAVPVCKTDEIRFGSSSRSYRFVLESGLADQARQRLFEKVANPEEGRHGKTAAGKELTVFVGNLPYSALEADVRAFFEPCGKIIALSLPKDKLAGDGHRGIAFVEFADMPGLTQALMRNGDELQGRALKISRQSAGKEGEKKAPAQARSKDYSTSASDEKSYYSRVPGAPPAGSLPHRQPDRSAGEAVPRQCADERSGKRSRSRSDSDRERSMRRRREEDRFSSRDVRENKPGAERERERERYRREDRRRHRSSSSSRSSRGNR